MVASLKHMAKKGLKKNIQKLTNLETIQRKQTPKTNNWCYLFSETCKCGQRTVTTSQAYTTPK
jgi:hypothetical protein